MQRSGKSTAPIVTSDTGRGKNAPGRLRAAWRVKGRNLPIGRGAAIRLLLISLVFVVLLQADRQQPPDPLDKHLESITSGLRFDLVDWEIASIRGKADDFFGNPLEGLSVEQQVAVVRDYLRMAQRAGELESKVERVYSDPAQLQPEAATEADRAELAGIRSQLSAKSSTVEAILEHQLASQIDAQGLTTGRLVWPPPRMRFSEPPQLLVVSPRERIQRLRSVDLKPELDSATRNSLEQAVEQNDGLSAYVTNIGGYGTWPAMVVDRFGLSWTLETIAHEWVHNYLAFHPLGLSLLANQNVTINETVASIVGEELGQAVLETYYPDLAPPPAPPAGQQAQPQNPAEPPPFDFTREMRATRVVVDKLLEQGYVDEAEAFMEARRQTFVAHGYPLRVLNQAYFAFHGSYATGAASTDPIGPKLRRLRELSPSLRGFLKLVDSFTSTEDLDQALQQLE